MTEEKIIMKAIVVTDQAAGTAGMTLVERPEPQAAINDVVVQVHASGFTFPDVAARARGGADYPTSVSRYSR
jgi:NADPH:quinone reductase-like Zn-dependent oxidoreductase